MKLSPIETNYIYGSTPVVFIEEIRYYHDYHDNYHVAMLHKIQQNIKLTHWLYDYGRPILYDIKSYLNETFNRFSHFACMLCTIYSSICKFTIITIIITIIDKRFITIINLLWLSHSPIYKGYKSVVNLHI